MLIACALGVVVAQSPQSPVPSQPSESVSTSRPALLQLQFGTFDPLSQLPEIPAPLRSDARHRLWIVQFDGVPTQAGRDALLAVGAEVHGYLPDNAYVVRMGQQQAAAALRAPAVRWVGPYHPAFRLEPALLQAQQWSSPEVGRYNFVVVDKRRDKPALAAKIRAIGGRVENEHAGSLLFEASLTGPQLLLAAGFDEVLWIDRWVPMELDVDNARIQGGANHVEAQVGYTGTGVNAHIYEGVEATHPDFTGGVVNIRSGGAADNHGHATAGIVFGNGTSNPAVRGLAPDAGKFYTNYSTPVGSRYEIVGDLVNLHNVSHTTASWGGSWTTTYTSISADTDDIIFDHDIAWTQSQSNTGNQNSRPQAWAKNVFSIGAVRHFDNSNPLDDSWGGGASTGPASDGRIKPDLCAYFDSIGTSDRTGTAGYTSTNWYASFSGTSGATPIVAGHNVLAIEMFTDDSITPGVGPFGNALRSPGGSVHSNRPHFTTLKALQVVSASQYAFTAASTDNRREHQGWGFPNLRTMWDRRARTFIVDEEVAITQGQTQAYSITVPAGEPSLKVCLNYADPAANPASSAALINNLSLRVTAPDNTVYWGNNGLTSGVWSLAGGSEDSINPIENVFVPNPQAGTWLVEVIATAVVQDARVETPDVDADYSLVVVGGNGQLPNFGSFLAFGAGCAGSVTVPSPACAALNENGGTLAGQTRQWEYCKRVVNAGTLQVLSFDIFTSTTTGSSLLRPAHIYADVGGLPSTTPLASTTIFIGPNPGFYTATFAAPVTVNGTFYVSLDSSSQNVVLSNLTAGANGTSYFRAPVTGTWSLSNLLQRPSFRVQCSPATTTLTPALAPSGTPVIGGSYSVLLADAAPQTFAGLIAGVSDSSASGVPLPLALPGAPGCDLFVSPDLVVGLLTAIDGTASGAFPVPNTASLVGFQLFHQWAVADAVNSLGVAMSGAVRVTIGG